MIAQDLARKGKTVTPVVGGVTVETKWIEKRTVWVTIVWAGGESYLVDVAQTPARAVRNHDKVVVEAMRLYLGPWAPEKYKEEGGESKNDDFVRGT